MTDQKYPRAIVDTDRDGFVGVYLEPKKSDWSCNETFYFERRPSNPRDNDNEMVTARLCCAHARPFWNPWRSWRLRLAWTYLSITD